MFGFDSKSTKNTPSSSSPPPVPLGHPEWKPWQCVVPGHIRNVCFAWQFVKYTFIFYLCIRQHNVLKKRQRMPRVLFGKVPPETFERARNYQMALNYLKMFSCVYFIIHEVWLILYAGFTKMWFLAGPTLELLGIWPWSWDWETGVSIVFIFLLDLHINLINLPLRLYRIFAIEEKYGFNKMTLGSYMWDWLEKLWFETVFTCITGVCILWIVRETGKYFFLWLWLFSFLWLLLTLAIYPNWVAPIFDTYKPLREGRLRTRLKKLADFLGFPLDEILVLHQSWRSEHRDAYFYGLLRSKRIVIYDTVLAGYPEEDEDSQGRRLRMRHIIPKKLNNASLESVPSQVWEKGLSAIQNKKSDEATTVSDEESSEDDSSKPAPGRKGGFSRNSMYDSGFTEYEIEAIVARLMGSWVMGHSIKQLIFPMISLFFFFLIFSYTYENSSLFQAFAVPKGMDKPILLGLRILYSDVMDIFQIFVEFVMKYLERQHCYEADAFATKLGYGEDLIDAYIEIEKENLSYPYFDGLYWGFHNWQPSALQSIAAIEKEMERMQWKVD